MRQNSVIEKINKAFQDHIAAKRQEDFSISHELSEEFTKLTRDLELKRQTFGLTRDEKATQREIDELIERIAGFNSQNKNQGSETGVPLVYDLEQKKVLEESSDESFAPIPPVSEQEAEKIIEGLNKQFEEKVVKKMERPIRKMHRDSRPNSGDAEGSHQLSGKGGGVSLQDYLSNFQDTRPDEPFSDEDSNFDLARFVDEENK